MGLFDKLFGKKDTNTQTQEKPMFSGDEKVAPTVNPLQSTGKNLNELAAQKDARPAATEEELMGYFVEYFAPNKEFFSEVGSKKYNAYFNVVNAARDEMLKNPDLFKKATKWDISQLTDLYNNPKPGITNMIVCGLIFRVGDYAVLPSHVLCVDFCEKIPNCISLYLLLTAQKLPEDKRKQLIDAGDRANKTAFKNVMKSLEVLDPHWNYTIY